jgi:RNA ligase (TIGR02306 family)
LEGEKMSELKVEVVKVLGVEKHPNADRLDCLSIKGWNVISAKDIFKKDDLGIYFPIDSILPLEIEEKIFPFDSKVKLTKSRVRTIKLRGVISQGLLIKPEVIDLSSVKEGEDLTTKLGVTKFEPNEETMPTGMQVGKKKKRENPNLVKYTDIDHLKKFYNVLQEGELVYISEKSHGTSVRVGYVKNEPTNIIDKIMKWLHLAPDYQRAWGSRNVQLQNKLIHKGFYPEDHYTKITKQYDLFNKIEKDTIIFGEIYGCGIQSGYTYGCTKGEVQLVIYDVMKEGRYLDYTDFIRYCSVHNLPRVPELYVGPYSLEIVKELSKGSSILCPKQKVREGIVIKPLQERVSHCGRVALKFINDDYLLKEQTDFH